MNFKYFTNKVLNHLYNMSPKRSNETTTTTPTISDETKDRIKYADSFIQDSRKLKVVKYKMLI